MEDQRFAESLKTLARGIGAKKLFQCPQCARKFNIANPKPAGIFKCGSCNVVMNPISEQVVATLGAEDVELMLDESIPVDVQNALKNPENVHGKFALLEKLGEGGMGAVFKAFDVELSRYVALKFIKSQQAAELRAEAKTLASLEHKNIARIYEVGTDFIAMQLIKGKTGTLTLEQFVYVCEAVDWAHKRGIVHRDIKPDNIMIDTEGNVFVMDFGLAIEGSSDEFAGTPGYIAPELVGSIQGDIYSLGATLYTLVTGRRPLEFGSKEDVQSVIEKCRSGVIPPLPENEIGAIMRKAMATAPQDRYVSAHEMALDIQRFMTGFPVSAYSASVLYRIRKSLKRNRALFLVTATLCAAIVVVSTVIWQSKESERQGEEQAKLAAQKRADEEKVVKELILRAHKIQEEGLSVLAGCKVYWYKKFERGKLAEEMQKFRDEVKKGLAKFEEAQKIISGATGGREEAYGYYLMAYGHHFLGDYQSAEKYYSKAIEKDPKFCLALIERGKLRSQKALVELISRANASGEGAMTYINAALSDFDRLESIGLNVAGTEQLRARDVAKGYELLVKQQYDKVIAHCDEKYSESGDEELFIIKGIAYTAVKGMMSAIREFENAIDKRTNYAEAHLWIGTIKYMTGDYSGALENVTNAIEINQRLPLAFSNRGVIKEAMNDCRGAVEDYSRELENDPDSAGALSNRGAARVRLAQQSLLAGEPTEKWRSHYQAAIDDCTKALQISPKFAAAYSCRGAAKDGLGDCDGCIEDCTKAIEIDSRHVAAYCNRASAKKKLNDFKGAIEDDTKALRVDPKFASAFVSRGKTKEKIDDYLGAIEDYEKAIEVSPNYADAYYYCGVALGELAFRKIGSGASQEECRSEFERAIETFSKAIEIDPKCVAPYLNRATAKLSIGDYHGAMDDFTKAIELDPKNVNAYSNRGAARLTHVRESKRSGAPEESWRSEYKEVIDDYTKAIVIDPAYSNAFLGRGSARIDLGEYEHGIEDCTKAIELDPGAPLAFTQRAIAYSRMEKYPAAKADFEKALLIASPDWQHRKTVEEYLRRINAKDY